MLAAVAVKVVLELPGDTVTVPGTLSNAVLLDSVTLPPAVFERVTVQVLDWPEARGAGLDETPVTRTGADRFTCPVCELPLRAAVTVAVWSAAIVPAVAVKVALALPADTVTVPGTVNNAVLLESVTL